MAKRGQSCRSNRDTPLINIQGRPQSNCTTIPNRNSGAGSSSCNSSTTTTTSKKQTQMMSGETTPRIERILVDDDESSETQSDDDDYGYVSGSEVILLYNVNHYIPSNEIGLGCMRLEPDVAEKGSSK
ncbi:hypothetical protein L6164_017816 [Bauhinia variegata]|uniref:Uncharacterized protein n=1 Tax=Bauhinia variegata TaxID=167791 RepID=A0ACB9N935_BAUVA|nr:hypothetical protein L6164_017816 [Bauhinia variegata]